MAGRGATKRRCAPTRNVQSYIALNLRHPISLARLGNSWLVTSMGATPSERRHVKRPPYTLT